MRTTSWGPAILAAALLFSGAAIAQTAAPGQPQQFARANRVAPASPRDQFVEKVNTNTVTVITATPSGTWLPMAHDMSAVLDDTDNMRVIAMLGKGSAQNILDILYLRGVDMAIVQANILKYFEKTGDAGRNIGQRLRYITRLHNQEIHIVGRAGIETIKQLNGKVVNFADVGSGTQITAQLLFESLGIRVKEVNMGQNDAFEKMKTGEVDATILSAGKPVSAFAKLKNENGFQFVQIPYEGPVQTNFVPASLTYEDYPNLIPKDKTVETLGESAVLISFNWAPNTDRYRRVAKFTEALFKNFDKFLEKPRHPKWKEVNLAAELPGWERFGAAKELLVANTRDQTAGQKRLKQDFAKFLTSSAPAETASTMSHQRREDLFRKFMEWQAAQR